jgi:hypothetical protein
LCTASYDPTFNILTTKSSANLHPRIWKTSTWQVEGS